jgi:hypothetical protein
MSATAIRRKTLERTSASSVNQRPVSLLRRLLGSGQINGDQMTFVVEFTNLARMIYELADSEPANELLQISHELAERLLGQLAENRGFGCNRCGAI